jgi:leader peptidase (prepilin peptidase)/N-methyltransferase
MHSEVTDLSLIERTNIASMTAMTAFWFFCVGASLGSFLNVVVYRLPRGMTLVRKKSSCPSCDQPIEMRDNIPIFGWLKLHGRCRNCGWHIPIRYPLVELAVAAQFVILFFVELISGGTNLPVRQPDFYAGVVWTVWYLKYPDLIQLYFFHCLLLYLSLALLLLAVDRQFPPRRLIMLGVLAGLVWLAIEPQLHPTLGLSRWNMPQRSPQRWAAIWSGLLGMASGAGMGTVLGMVIPDSKAGATQSALIGIFSLSGLYLGPSTVISVTVLALMVHLCAGAMVAPRLSHLSLAMSLVVGIHIQILAWRHLAAIPFWPSHAQPWQRHTEILAVVVVVVTLIRQRILDARLAK